MPLDPEIQAVLSAMAAMNAPPMSQGTPEAARAAFRFMTVDMRRPDSVIPVKETEDVTIPVDGAEIAAREIEFWKFADHNRVVRLCALKILDA